ncbi:uncharacterized protein LOC121192106 [Toxotes jaculatrix]|uniref:uncharacterized protein LOC121192106 n=1 Tax=Toxotes jaculatrix TaxID=941984 RepID=UPI001B3B1545|nr:uncharacterized protein LOC121192106 [Toxotes jaculatrix]
MQPDAAQGVCSQSELFDSLKVYLNNKNRLQPIIGLGSIIECVKVDARSRNTLYLCEVCVCRLGKADMRNHIMGSLHRYNYIKTWYPQLLSEWKENSDLPKLAWPLMEIAKTIEETEGAGHVQLLEVEDTVYQKMATHSENDAVTLINSLREWQGQGAPETDSETTSVLLEDYPIQSQRIVLLAQNKWRWFEKSRKADMIQHKTSAQTNEPPALIQSTASSVKSEGWLKNISASQLDNTQKSSEPCLPPTKSSSFLDCYTGTKPLIGLFRVVECKSEDGRTYAFLCHCCRIRSNKKDIIDHLTSSSHLINYLMETHPEQVEAVTADIYDNCQFLQSLAKKVEQEEGRGEQKVVNVPESLCILLTGKSYHWCIKMLCNEWTHTSTQKNKITVEGPGVNKTSVEGVSEKRAVVQSKWAKRMKTNRRMRKVTNTVFKVSLPLTKGSVLLERMSFSEDSLRVSHSHSSASDLIPSPESLTEDNELDCDTGSLAVNHFEHPSRCATLQLQPDHRSGDTQAGQYMGLQRNYTVTQYQKVDSYYSDDECFSQPEDTTVTKDQKVYGERNYNRQHCSQGRSSKNFNRELKNEDLQKQNEGLSLDVPHTQDWASYNPSYRWEEGFTAQRYCAASQSKVDTRVEVSREEKLKEISSGDTQPYYQQQLQHHYRAPDHTSLLTGSVGCHSVSVELVPHAARINTDPYSGDFLAHSSSSIAPEPRIHFLESEKKQLQAYIEFTTSHVQTAPQSYMMQPAAYQATQIGHWVISDTGYSNGLRANPEQHFPHPGSSSSGGGGGTTSQSYAFTPPVQALYYGTHSDLNFRDTKF